MLAGKGRRRNFGGADRGYWGKPVDSASPLLALRLAGQDHALEPGRDYLLGSDAACDLRVGAGAATTHARLVVSGDRAELIHLGGEVGTFHNGDRVEHTVLAAGDVLRFGDGGAEAIVVRDDGNAAIVPIPAMRAAAVARRQQAVRSAARALRRDGPTFHQLTAQELRRAPWLLVSLLLHLLLLLSAWLLSPVQRYPDAMHASVAFDVGGETANPVPGPPAPPEVMREQPEAKFDVGGALDPALAEPRDAQGESAVTTPSSALRQNARVVVRSARPDSGAEHGAGGGVEAIGSGAFQRAVSELRRSGLEIVFVFDSTGSMTRTILDTKSTIAQMLAVLEALVPDARVGLVTFRDHGRNEDYLLRQVPLGRDFWRLSNFMQTVTADGGGDLPEAVRAGLSAAFGQTWRPGARRVVVLAGDAPPHEEDNKRMLSEVRAFAGNGRSFVHALITCDESRRDPNAAFAAIAEAGRGLCERIERRDRVLQRVLTLAFGREFDHDVAAVVRAVDERSHRIDVTALDLVRRGGPDLARALCQPPVPQPLWNALVRRPRRATAEQLVELLGASSTPDQSRHAIAAALQRVLELPLPPLDPEGTERPQQRELDRLRRAAAGLPE